MEKEPKAHRLARHWYDVDCILQKQIADPLDSDKAMHDVVEMKKQRWAERGVDYEAVLRGQIQLVPGKDRLSMIAEDHRNAVDGRMFYSDPDVFDEIIHRVSHTQDKINQKMLFCWVKEHAQLRRSGAWVQAVIPFKGKSIYSELALTGYKERALASLVQKIGSKEW